MKDLLISPFAMIVVMAKQGVALRTLIHYSHATRYIPQPVTGTT
jgi:hypothetical protein